MARLAALAFVVVAACGGHKPATSTREHVDEMGHDEHGMPAEVSAFHDRLAPLFHMAAGADRTRQTCDATGDFEKLLTDLENTPPPADVDAQVWGERIGGLRSAVVGLGLDCSDNAAGNFEGKFSTVHDSFHALLEALPQHEEK